MKVLVYGAGVIGSYLAHVLCEGKNDVSLLARGSWKQHLETDGLRIHHHLQRKDTVDHPRVIEAVDEEFYDAVFAVMPYHRMFDILDDLAAVHSPYVILVGNNMSSVRMRDYILRKTACEKTVLFGFQATAGARDREKGILICERAGTGTMDIGLLHEETAESVKAYFENIFQNTKYRLNWQPDMEAYLICHLAAVLPLGYLAYACDGNMRTSTSGQRKMTMEASKEAYGMLKQQGIRILPEGDAAFYEGGPLTAVMKLLYLVMAKSEIGDLVACAHCRNAYAEMEMLSDAFDQIIAKSPDYPMENWNALKAQMPARTALRLKYGKHRK